MFLVKCELNNCYRCGKIIESVKVLHIDHKIPFLHSKNPVELFFDLDNIAFSHAFCNNSSKRCMSVVRSKTGFKGIFKDGNRYKPEIRINGKKKYLGIYLNPEDAALAYDKAALEHWGERAVTNKSLGLL